MKAEQRLHNLVDGICAAGQPDITEAAVVILAALLNGGVALRHMRMYPQFAAEAVHQVLSPKKTLKPKAKK